MFKLDLEKAEEPEIKLPSIGSLKSKRIPEKKCLLLFYWLSQSLCVDHNKLLKFLKRWEYKTPDLPPEKSVCWSRSNSYKQTWYKTVSNWEEVCQGYILSPFLFNLCAENIMWNARLDEAQSGIKIAGRNINNLRYADDTTLMAERKEYLKSLLMKVKEDSEKVGLKLNI